ncbi:MAG TPA: efflux RND transporter periplasmic adaptor subunit [Bacteroidales bacterium]|nr:efflux RND transporter periplasmic adaptor subunit [Bacteroidales bacterium]
MYKIFISLVLISAIFYSYSCQSPQASENASEMGKLAYARKVIDVNAKVIKPASFYKEVLGNGVLNPVKKARLVFKVNENIQKVYVQNGQWVKQGEPLVQLEQFNQKVSLEKAKNNLLKAEIELKDILFAHSPDLSDTSKIPPKVLETARGRSGYNDALIAVKEAEYNLAQTTIYAPFDGLITDMQVKENNFSGNYGFFASLLDNRQMEVVFGVMETELAMLSKGAKVMVSPYAFPEKKIEGQVSEINPVVGENGMVQVKAVVPNADGVLLDGMNVEVLVRQAIHNQLVVPKEAVLLRQEKQMLFTLKNDSIAQWVYIKTGIENTSGFTVIDGLSAGDTVIISNNFNLGHDVVVNATLLN